MLVYRRFVWWYLATPILLFLLSWFNTVLALPLAGALIYIVYRASPYSDIPRDSAFRWDFSFIARLLLTTHLAMFVTWEMIQKHYWDWVRHHAILFDLSRCSWPISYDYQGTAHLLSYYLPYYLIPALMVKATDMAWLPRAVELWTFLGYWLLLWGYFSRSKTIIEWLVLFFLMISLSGWPVFEHYWETGQWNAVPGLSTYIEPFWWVPNHLIPAALAAGLLIHPDIRRQDRVRFGVPLLVLFFYWSPLGSVGLAVFILADLIAENPFKTVLQNKLVFFLGFCLIVPYQLYLSRDISLYIHYWYNRPLLIYGKILLFHPAVHMAAILLLAPVRRHRNHLASAAVVLMLCPLYRFGAFDDLNLRIPMTIYYVLLFIGGDGALSLVRQLKAAHGRAPQPILRLAGALAILTVSLEQHVYEVIPVVSNTFGFRLFTTLNPNPFSSPNSWGIQRLKDVGRDKVMDHYLTPVTPVKAELLREPAFCPALVKPKKPDSPKAPPPVSVKKPPVKAKKPRAAQNKHIK